MLIRECAIGDVVRLEDACPSGTNRYAQAVERQQAGECAFLVAWDGDEPLGHAEVMWQGCRTTEVRAVCPDCPEINGLRVYRADLRGRGIGTALIRSAEDRARDRGFQLLGLGVGDDNPRAARLYERLGYEARMHYTAVWTYEDTTGAEHLVEDPRTFMVRDLTT